MKCAIVPKESIKYVQDFCNEMQECLDTLKNYEDGNAEQLAKDQLIEKVKECSTVFDHIRHFITAYDTIYRAACDPKLPYLEYRRDFKEFLDNKEAGRNGYTDFPENSKDAAFALVVALNATYKFDDPEGKYHALCQNDFTFENGNKVCVTVEIDHYEHSI